MVRIATLLAVIFSFSVSGHANVLGAKPKRWATEMEIIQLIYSLELADFPIKQRDIDRDLPLPPRMPYAGGNSARSPAGAEATLYALTEPDQGAGFYALRTVLKIPAGGITETTVLPDLEITAAEVLFICQPSIWLSVSSVSPHHSLIERLRQEMKKENLTPRMFIERWSEKQPLFYWQSTLTEKPNKAPEPTPTSVTPPAAQESRRP